MDNLKHFKDENALWSAIKDGDAAAFKELYEAYADVLYRYGLRYLKDTDTIKDCIHDLFVDLHRYSRNLSATVNIRFYLLGAFRRKLRDAHKKAAAWQAGADTEMEFLIEYDTQHLKIADEEQRHTMQQLAAALRKLPARQKEVIYLRYNAELSYEEVANVMKISVPTCRTLAYRAFQQLREQLKQVPVYCLVACVLALLK